jgi:hypothetical protein
MIPVDCSQMELKSHRDHGRGMLQTTSPAEIHSLLAAPEECSLASAYLHAILDDLDEVRPSAAAELHSVLGSAVGSILVGWPER